MFTTKQIRSQWIDFWLQNGHQAIPYAGVVPENDPTALFHNSGMHPLVPYLMGEDHPKGKRLVNVQPCIRTGDIEEVGDNTHLTFFEMLGNWSLGDFFKTEQIQWSFEFLVNHLQLPVDKLAVSVFAGDNNAPRDEEAALCWQKSGIPAQRIAFLPAAENWWAKGAVGPCGPDTEIFYWTKSTPPPDNFQETWSDPGWVEVWNNVFMQFNKQADGTLQSLPSKNVDTGMGLERTVAVLNGQASVYQTDAFEPTLSVIAKQTGHPEIVTDPLAETAVNRSAHIIADHLRAACIIMADGVNASNVDQGYVLRRLVRRSMRHARLFNTKENFLALVAAAAIDNLGGFYTYLASQKDEILTELNREAEQFARTLAGGEKQWKKLISLSPASITGKQAFDLYQTYGFPIEMIVELANENNLDVDQTGFQKAYADHQNQSRSQAQAKFGGGLTGEDIFVEKQLHTATHLMLAGLRHFLGSGVHQAGSNINPQRTRFDFTHPEKVDRLVLDQVEQYVNDAIAANAVVQIDHVPKAEAEKDPSIEGSFWEKYPDVVKVYTFRDATGQVWSRELCGGPHVEQTSDIQGRFRITKQESSSRGVRRIKAILEPVN